MTDSYLTLTTFVPGTKAKADEVNANFSALKDALINKATMSGDSTKNFSVADSTADKHAVNKSQMDKMAADLKTEIAKTGTKFCVKSGNITDGKGDLFSYDVLRITPKIGGVYGNLVFLDYAGAQTTVSSTPATLSMSGKPDGDYNIFIKPDGVLYTLGNKIYKQPPRPALIDGDIWLNTSVEPFYCIKYDGTNDVPFLDVPLGKVTIASSVITKLETFEFNQNGHSVSTKTTLERGTNLAASIGALCVPDYANGVTKSFNTSYTAEVSGFIYVCGNLGAIRTITIDGFTFEYVGGSTGAAAASIFIPIAKGSVYSVSSGAFFTFFPMRAVG